MRILVLFDLPTESLEEKREYRKFRKALIKKGFIMMQESVYSKLALNTTAVASIEDYVRANKPKYGLVQMMVVTEKQFSRMEYLTGQKQSVVVDSDERTVIL